MHSIEVVPRASGDGSVADRLVLQDSLVPQPGLARIAITGDFCPHGLGAPKPGANGGVHDVVAGLAAVAEVSDLTIVNLECPLQPGFPIRKSGPRLARDADWARVLGDAGVNVASLANNHVLDRGPEALAATMDLCRAAGMDTVGAGADLEAAALPLIREVRGCASRSLDSPSTSLRPRPRRAEERLPAIRSQRSAPSGRRPLRRIS